MTTQYMILCHARTGSNYLVNVLTQHADIESHNEIFHETTIFLSSGAVHDPDEIAKRNADPVSYLKAVLAQPTKPVRGFKHLLFYHEEIIDYVIQNNFHLILLERENVLAQYSSMAIAHQTEQWTLNPGERAVEASKLVWDEAEFEAYRHDYIAEYNELKQRADARKYPVLYMRYVDLFDPKCIRRVFEFLGLSSSKLTPLPMIRKQNTSHITERFDQPDAVRSYLEKIGHVEWEFEQVREV